VLLAVALTAALLALPGAAAAKPRALYWGAWIGPQLTGEEAPWDMSAARRFQGKVGHGLSLLQFSAPFADCGGKRCEFYSFPTNEMEKIRRHGAIPLFSWNSGASGADPRRFGLAELRRGRYDSHIRAFARAARDWGHPFFLRFNWEMNGDWFPWGAGVNGNRPGEFKAAWRRVHDIFRRVGAGNATWVWCPYARDEPLAPFYPGDRYVDWTCLDGYNWGPDSSEPAPWRSFREIFTPAYRQVAGQIAPRKPMLLAEVASSGDGPEKAAWIRGMFASLRRGFPKVRGLVWFDKADNDNDWPIESSHLALDAFGKGLRHRYKQNVYADLGRSPIPPPRR
jgi:Glycosyl hydrolase family 26